jgi:hypothetical protein
MLYSTNGFPNMSKSIALGVLALVAAAAGYGCRGDDTVTPTDAGPDVTRSTGGDGAASDAASDGTLGDDGSQDAGPLPDIAAPGEWEGSAPQWDGNTSCIADAGCTYADDAGNPVDFGVCGSNGVCKACGSDKECSAMYNAPFICLDGQCWAGNCHTSADCSDSGKSLCENLICQPDFWDGSTPCLANLGCWYANPYDASPANLIGICFPNGVCGPCTSNSDCAYWPLSGTICFNGVCTPPGGQPGPCVSDTDCVNAFGSGYVCAQDHSCVKGD